MYVFWFLITVFVTLFEEDVWPDDPIDYARNFFKATPKEEIEAAVAENERLKKEITEVEAKITEVTKQLEELNGWFSYFYVYIRWPNGIKMKLRF